MSLTTAACSGHGETEAPPGPGTVVRVKLEDYNIVPDLDPVTEGRVVLEVRNAGPQKRHELMMVRSDVDADALPVRGDGSVETDELEFTAKVGAIDIGGAVKVDLALDPGRYVLFCNLVDREPDGELKSHYELRMHSVLTVVAAPASVVPGALTPPVP